MYRYRCPYCKCLLEWQIDFYGHNDGDEETFDELCEECGKLCYLKIMYYRDSSSIGADVEVRRSCELNEEDHDWRPYTSVGLDMVRCAKCLEIQTIGMEQLDFLAMAEVRG
jgi:uncharacterized cysteine cluster protein YcgN (CxxCxxCC family)